jgi:protein TonB
MNRSRFAGVVSLLLSTLILSSCAALFGIEEEIVFEPIPGKLKGTETVVETGAEFNRGYPGLIRDISRSIKYPDISRRMSKQGTVFVRFVVDEDAKVIDVTIEKGVDFNLDQEAVRVIKNLKPWVNGTYNNAPAAFEYTVPVSFRL